MSQRKRLFFLLLGCCLLVLFSAVSYLVKKDIFQRLDFDTTVRLQNHISRRFDLAFSVFSLLGSVEFTAAFLLSIFVIIFLKLKHLFWGIILYFFILFAELLGKLFIFHPGPPFGFFRYSLGFTFPSSYIHTNYSYPSGHMARTAFFIVILFFLVRHFSFPKSTRFASYVIICLFGAIMFLSRVYLGEHWFSDVLGGMLLGFSLGSLSLALW